MYILGSALTSKKILQRDKCQFLIFKCTFAFSTPCFSCNCCMHDPTSNADLFIVP